MQAAKGSPLIYNHMMFAAQFTPFSRVWACVLTSERRRYASSVNARSIPKDLVMFTEPGQDRFMNTLPTACLHPFVKATPACHAAAAAKLTRQILPRYSGPEDEQNSSQGGSVIDARPSAFRRPTMIGKMSGYKRPRVFGKKCSGHGIDPVANTLGILMPMLPLRTSATDPGCVKT